MFPKFMSQAGRIASVPAEPVHAKQPESSYLGAEVQPAGPDISAHVPEEHSLGEAVRDLGGYHEDLRNRCESALSTLTSLKTTAQDVETIFIEFGKITRELHNNRKELAEANRLLGLERGSVEDFRSRLSTAQTALQQGQAQMDELLARHDLLSQSHTELQGLFTGNQSKLRDAEARLKIVEPELLAAREAVADLTARTTAQETALLEADQTIHDLREEVKLLKASLEFEVSERQKFGKVHEEVLARFAAQQKALVGTSEDLRAARELVTQHEARQASFASEREAMIVALETAKAMHEADSKNFEVKIEAVSARARLAEHLLEKTRSEQRDAFRDQTAHTEALRQIRRLETSVESCKQDLQDALRRCRDLEGSEQAYKARVEGQEASLREKQRNLEKSAEKIRNLQDLLQATQERHTNQISLIDEQVKKFTEELERERADRVYLEGALSTARRDRATLQAMIIKLKAAGQDDVSGILGEIAAKLDELPSQAVEASKAKSNGAVRASRANGAAKG